MKRFLLLFAFLYGLSAYADNVIISKLEFSVSIIKNTGTGNPFPKSPALLPEPPEATLVGNVLTFISTHDAYTLTLIDENGEVAYEVTVPSTVNVVVLSPSLTGDFELLLDSGGSYYFYCDIEL